MEGNVCGINSKVEQTYKYRFGLIERTEYFVINTKYCFRVVTVYETCLSYFWYNFTRVAQFSNYLHLYSMRRNVMGEYVIPTMLPAEITKKRQLFFNFLLKKYALIN